MGIKFEFSLLGRSHIHWGETGYQDVIVEVSYDDLADLALANGYVKLEPGQEIIERRILNVIDDHCVGCTFFWAEARDCATCDLKPIRDRITEARDE